MVVFLKIKVEIAHKKHNAFKSYCGKIQKTCDVFRNIELLKTLWKDGKFTALFPLICFIRVKYASTLNPLAIVLYSPVIYHLPISPLYNSNDISLCRVRNISSAGVKYA